MRVSIARVSVKQQGNPFQRTIVVTKLDFKCLPEFLTVCNPTPCNSGDIPNSRSFRN